MSFQALSMQREDLPWSWPTQTGSTLRSRFILTALDRKGRRHQAELAPCPGVHPETLDQAAELWLRDMEPLLLQRTLDLKTWSWTSSYFGLVQAAPAAATSVQTAAEQLLLSWAQTENPSAYCIDGINPFQGSALLLPQRDAAASWDEFLRLWEQGFRVYKCKVGRLEARDECAFLQRIVDFGRDAIALRLDGNRRIAAADLQLWREKNLFWPIEYWEEPSTQPMESIGRRALDESLWDLAPTDLPHAEVWILKSTRLGLARTVHILQSASKQGISCVLSNAFESGLSLRCAAWLYARFCTKPRVLGFGTARFLPADSWQNHAWGAAQVPAPLCPFALDGE